MNSRTPSENNNGQYTPYAQQQLQNHQQQQPTGNSATQMPINVGPAAVAGTGAGGASATAVVVTGRTIGNHTPQAHSNLLAESHGSTYLSSPNDTMTTSAHGEAESPMGEPPSNWSSPPTRPQIPPIVSTSMTSSTGGLTSPASLSSPVQITQSSPSSQQAQTTLPQQQQLQQQQQQQQTGATYQPQPQQPLQKPKKEKHSFGGMSASSFLTETLPGAGMKLYPSSKRGAKSHGDMSVSSGKSKKSASGSGNGGGPLSSISTRKHQQQQQLSPGGHSSIMDSRTYSSSSNNISSPMTGSGSQHHYMTSPTLSRNNHSSLDAKVMAREMSQGHSTEDVWQALCIKVLTLFNGQGLTGAIEDLNELVRYV